MEAMTFEERKQECIKRGIVPGAMICCITAEGSKRTGDYGLVLPYSMWRLRENGSIAVGYDGDGAKLYAFWASPDAYATVITPAPAEPSEVDRLRERVKELEGAAYDFTKKVIAAFPFLDSENPKQVDVYMSLHDLKAILNKTTNTPEQQ